MAFTILSDADIQQIFQRLSSKDVESFLQVLSQALEEYSGHDEKKYQPHRSVVTRSEGQTTLFMPATTKRLGGVKIVGISSSGNPKSHEEDPKPLLPSLKSTLVLCDGTGQAIGVLNAAELTAFRTALGSMLLFKRRETIDNILVFGAGKQALWHIRLALLLRSQDIKRITIVNRSARRTQELISTLSEDPNRAWPQHINLDSLENGHGTSSTLESLVAAADVIFCTTPSTQALFPAQFLTSENSKSKARYIAAIGSYRLDMMEIDPTLLKEITDPQGFFSSQVWKGMVVVDSVDGCLQEAGELVKAGIGSHQMLELGTVHHTLNAGSALGLDEWVRSGFVVYKSVGVGIMDIAIGERLLQMADGCIGTSVDTF